MKWIKSGKTLLSTLGLVMITLWSAVQYLFYSNVPEDTSTFEFLFLTNLCGCLILALTQPHHLKKIKKPTIKKAVGLSIIQLLMNFFVILGSRSMDPVIISGVMSLYFVFVTPLLLLMRKKVSFRSGVATVIALIALLLVFNANFDGLFSSANVIFLLIADLFFAGYIVAISFATEGEDPQAMAVVQMAICALLSLVVWLVEVKVFCHGSLTIGMSPDFWASVLFIGVFIRALYSVIQFAAQKNVPPINASLIFASEVVITLVLNPVLSRFFGTVYEPATVFQIVGCVLFVIAILICDDAFMKKFHYNDMETRIVIDEHGNEKQQTSISRKIVNMNLLVGLGTLILSTLVCLFSIFIIRDSVIDSSRAFGNDASGISETALLKQTENALSQKAADKVAVVNEKLDGYRSAVQYAADMAGQILSEPDSFKKTSVGFPITENADIWTMQMTLANEDVDAETVRPMNEALGNMETLFASIQSRNPDLTTIYIGTEEGLMISYDPNSGLTEVSGAPVYYEYHDSEWYKNAKGQTVPLFTDTYPDGAGRGLTITCYAPIYDNNGNFLGSLGMDFLQSNLNEQLVNVGITAPEKAALVSSYGTVIAVTDESSDNTAAESIINEVSVLHLRPIAKAILGQNSGLLISEDDTGGYYVAFSEVEATGWKLCIINPVENIVAPAATIRCNIESNTEKISITVRDGIRRILAWCLIFFAAIILLITCFVGLFSQKITKPLKQLEEDVQQISNGNFDRRTTVETQDEIGNLARAFNGMANNLRRYISDPTDDTKREEPSVKMGYENDE